MPVTLPKIYQFFPLFSIVSDPSFDVVCNSKAVADSKIVLNLRLTSPYCLFINAKRSRDPETDQAKDVNTTDH